MLDLYYTIIYEPLLNLLVFLYNNIPGHDIGIAIIVITIIIRIVLAPFMHKSLKGQQAMQSLQPKLNEIREKYKDDQQAQAKAIMDMYRENKINPLSSCLPLIIQLPILIALYQVLSRALGGNLEGLYSFINNPGSIDPFLFGIINLAKPNYIFAILAGLAQFWQSKLTMPASSGSTDPTAKIMTAQVTYILPIISVVVAWKLPAGLPLYWIVTTLFAIGQQYFIMRQGKQIENS